jgi:hypothetical protein
MLESLPIRGSFVFHSFRGPCHFESYRLDRNTKDKPKPKARYINNLIKSAEERKKLDFLRKENAAERERRLEGEEYADKDEFVTEAFKTHLEELREFEQREKEEAEQEGTSWLSFACVHSCLGELTFGFFDSEAALSDH